MDDGTIKHSAKAARTIAKTAGKAIDAGRELGAWLNKIFGKAIVDTVGLYWTDRVAARRIEAAVYDWKRLALLFHAAENELKRRKVKALRPLPPKVALPLIEHATMENERHLRKMWANLLATALTPFEEAVTQTYVTVLGELTAHDARALEKMYSEWMTIDQKEKYNSGPVEYEIGVDVIGSRLDTGAKLHRLGIILPTTMTLDVNAPPRSWSHGEPEGTQEYATVVGELDVVKFSKFGESFCRAVGMRAKNGKR